MKSKLPFLIILSLFTAKPFARADLTANKKLVTSFYDLAFNQHQAKLAAEKYLAEIYIQHNPHVGTGRQAFIDAFAGEGPNDESSAEFKRTIAEGDLVVLHSHKHSKKGDRGVAGIDIFRVKENKIVEHWDINQPIPEKSANPNTMF